MHYLKIVSKGWAGYNGQLNIITFKDGVSTEPVPPQIANRISAAVSVVECDADGAEPDERVNIGVQHRLISETLMRAPVAAPLKRMTDQDRVMEVKLDAARALTSPTENLYTTEDLEALADKSGIKGLREVGDAWQVSARSIPDLIKKILEAQLAFQALRNAAVDKASETVLKATTQATDEEAAPKEVIDDTPVIAGLEGAPVEYTAGDVIVPFSTLIDAALKNSGKSLTGWNGLQDSDRAVFIDREIKALELHYGLELVPVHPAPEEPADQAGEDA